MHKERKEGRNCQRQTSTLKICLKHLKTKSKARGEKKNSSLWTQRTQIVHTITLVQWSQRLQISPKYKGYLKSVPFLPSRPTALGKMHVCWRECTLVWGVSPLMCCSHMGVRGLAGLRTRNNCALPSRCCASHEWCSLPCIYCQQVDSNWGRLPKTKQDILVFMACFLHPKLLPVFPHLLVFTSSFSSPILRKTCKPP